MAFDASAGAAGATSAPLWNAFQEPIVAPDGFLRAHHPICRCLCTKPSACDCLQPYCDGFTGRLIIPTTITISGTPITTIKQLLDRYRWHGEEMSIFQALNMLFAGEYKERKSVIEMMRTYAMENFGTGSLPEITPGDVEAFSRQQ